MKVLHVLTEPKGGGGTYALMLASACAARGDTVALASPRPLETTLPQVPLARASLGRLRRASRGSDVVHLHGSRATLLRPLLAGRHTIVTTHGLHALRAAGGWKRRAVALVLRALLARVDAIVCVSEAEVHDLRRLGVPGERLHLILNGVARTSAPDPAERGGARERLGLTADAYVVLFAGSLIHQKNPQLAVAAAARAGAARPELVLLVAGDGDLRGDVEAAAEGRVRLLGQRSDMDDLFAAADVLLNTSRWEGLSLAILEALWRGLPCVVTDAPGNAEAVGDAGLVVEQRAEAVAAALVELANGTRRADLTARARERAQALFDSDVMVAATLRLYDRVAGSEAQPTA